MAVPAILLALGLLNPGEFTVGNDYHFHFGVPHRTLHADDEIVHRHALPGRVWKSATVRVDCGHCSGGTCAVELECDGRRRPLFTVDKVGPVTASVPADLLPAKELSVRIRGGAGVWAQIWNYDVDAVFSGEPHDETGGNDIPAPDEVWTAPSGWRVPHNGGLVGVSGDRLTIRTARDEAESAQLVVSPKRTLTGLRVTVGPLRNGGTTLPAEAVAVFRVGFVPVVRPSDDSSTNGLFADPLFAQTPEGLAASACANVPFWIRIRPPRTAKPGIYRGTATVVASGFRRTVPVELEVFPFRLPPCLTCRTSFFLDWKTVARYHGLISAEDRKAVFARYLKAMEDYRLSPYDPAPDAKWTVRWEGEGESAVPVFDFSVWDAAMALALDGRHFNSFVLHVPSVGGWMFSPSGDDTFLGHHADDPARDVLLGRYLGGLERHLAERGWLEAAYLYWFDEPNERDFPVISATYGMAKRLAPRLRRMVTKMPSANMGEGPNLWCPLTSHYDRMAANERRAKGEDFWWYICCSPKAPYAGEFIDHPLSELRTWLWQTWAEDVKGVLVAGVVSWTSRMAYPDPSHPQNPYLDTQSWDANDTDPPGTRKPYGNGDGRFFYPPLAAASGRPAAPVLEDPVPSVRLEMLRDGLEDYEYFAILKAMLKRTSGKLAAAERQRYEDLLKVPPEVSKSLTDFSRDPNPMARHREKLARAIVDLHARR